MDYEKPKLLKIANEIAFFCLNIGAEKLHIDLSIKEKTNEVSLRCQLDNITEEELEKLQQTLEVPRREDVEDYFWELAGESESARELSLVGMLIDKVEISYTKPHFKIIMNRNK